MTVAAEEAVVAADIASEGDNPGGVGDSFDNLEGSHLVVDILAADTEGLGLVDCSSSCWTFWKRSK